MVVMDGTGRGATSLRGGSFATVRGKLSECAERVRCSYVVFARSYAGLAVFLVLCCVLAFGAYAGERHCRSGVFCARVGPELVALPICVALL
jgi:hypothetical protein